jgi:glutamyl-tRNA reductase
MHSQLVVVHRKKPSVFRDLPGGWRTFVTCLRSLAVSFSHSALPPDLSESDQVFRGSDAYRFLLEVACGLQSPILGETEVFGQFRRFAEEWPEHSAFFQNVFADVKVVRGEHLSHLGSSSYGSWVRKQVRDGETVHVVGTGQLAQEIQLWLRKQNDVRLYSRNPVLATQRLVQTPLAENLQIRDLASAASVEGAVVVIASPLTSAEISKWLGGQTPQILIDLRDDASIDLVACDAPSFRLHDIFVEIEAGRTQAKEKVAAARHRIDQLVNKRFQSQVVRPFGWDDLCA